jgi:hypothetical protein
MTEGQDFLTKEQKNLIINTSDISFLDAFGIIYTNGKETTIEYLDTDYDHLGRVLDTHSTENCDICQSAILQKRYE